MKSAVKLPPLGFSLVEVLIAIGILGIAMTAMTSMISYQSNAIKHLESKLAILDLERHMITALSNSSICTYAVTNPAPQSFDSTVSTSTVSLPRIQASANVSAPDIVAVGSTVTSGVTVQSITIKDIQNSGAADNYNAHLVVSFLNSSGPVLKPLDFLVSMNTNPVSPANAKDVTNCNTVQSVSTGGHGIQVFTESGYFVVPTGVTSVDVTVQGAGGGGGGGGGVAIGTVSVIPHTQVYVQVGDGGGGGYFNVGNTIAPTDGGPTSFGASIVCTGGRNGDNSSTRAGGTCTGGSSTTAGNPGVFHGAGGSGQGLGAGAGGVNGVAGGVFGGGGGGNAGMGTCAGWIFCGGAGAPGRVIVEW